MAEREGFEPSIELPLSLLSREALSTAQPSLRILCALIIDLRLIWSSRFKAKISAFMSLSKSLSSRAVFLIVKAKFCRGAGNAHGVDGEEGEIIDPRLKRDIDFIGAFLVRGGLLCGNFKMFMEGDVSF